MKKCIIYLIMTVLVISLLISGCSNGSPNNVTKTNESKVDQVLQLNLGEEPPTLDPQKATDVVSYDVLNAVLEGLVRFDKNGQIKQGSGLAKNWRISKDGLTYTFNLKDAKWSDGNPITANDFEYAWKRALDPNTAAAFAYELYYIKGAKEYNTGKGTAEQVAVKALNDKTLQVTLNEPTPQFLDLLASPIYFPLEKSIYEKYGDNIGTSPDKLVYSGPFILKTWNHEQNLELYKNENYWDKNNVKLQKVILYEIKDTNTEIQNYEAGELDEISLNGDFIDKYKDSKEFHVQPLAVSWFLQFNNKDQIFKNANIRKAFTLSIDRSLLINNVIKNGSIPAESAVPDVIKGYQLEFRKEAGEKYFKDNDVKHAQEYLQKGLKELGLTKLPTITLLGEDSDTAKKYDQALQQMWNKNLGVNVQIKSEAFKVYLDDLTKGNYELAMSGWGANYCNDPMAFLDMWETNNANNSAFYSNPNYDRLIEEAKAINNLKIRNDKLIQAEKILMNDMGIGPLYFESSAYILKSYVKDFCIPKYGGPDWEIKWAYIEK
ncbi:peptide ABC transporter substrate-binding protein [Thermoanaerobacterium thermosaccharolyticum]|uniref:peptide ABC transporter substrate-binding protein n=1 Tax=Thermoanaerobacterium thermosaccharolyticum TaxID=1517 RepID=UPI003DA8FE7A